MRLAKTFIAGAIAAAAFNLPATAYAADAAVKVSVGATVSDTSGNPVGTIEQVNGDLAVLSTGKNKVSLPLNSFGQGANGPVIAMTRDQVDAAAAGATASAAATPSSAVVSKGAVVSDTTGAKVGTIEAVEGDFAVVATANSKVRLPVSAFGKGATGPVIAMSAAQLDAAAKAAAPTAKN